MYGTRARCSSATHIYSSPAASCVGKLNTSTGHLAPPARKCRSNRGRRTTCMSLEDIVWRRDLMMRKSRRALALLGLLLLPLALGASVMRVKSANIDTSTRCPATDQSWAATLGIGIELDKQCDYG